MMFSILNRKQTAKLDIFSTFTKSVKYKFEETIKNELGKAFSFSALQRMILLYEPSTEVSKMITIIIKGGVIHFVQSDLIFNF